MVICENHGLNWTLYEHLRRKTQSGNSGIDHLKNRGIDYRIRKQGDVRIALNGRSKDPSKQVLYVLQSPRNMPHAYLDLAHRGYIGVMLGIDSDMHYVIHHCGDRPVKNMQRAFIRGILDYKPDWSKKDRYMVTMQSAFGRRVNNPFPYSDLYEMRMQRVKHSACKFGKDFDFFGNSNPTGLPNYRGSIRDNRRYDYIKMDTLARYKFCLCMQNSRFDGYFTQKMQHALLARTIPVYRGAPDARKYVPKQLFIDVFDFGSISDCLDYVNRLSDTDVNQRIRRIDDFISDEKLTYPISSVRLADNLMKVIGYVRS